MSITYAAAALRDWVPTSLSLIWNGQWLETAALPNQSCIELALRAISNATSSLRLEAYRRNPDYVNGAEDVLWTWYKVYVCRDEERDVWEVGELRIPRTPSSIALDQAAELYVVLELEMELEPWNFYQLEDSSIGLELSVGHSGSVYAPDGYCLR